jgi:hypothetical protein
MNLINWHGEGQRGIVDAEATIRQDFLRVSMEVYCGPVLRHPAELIQAANDMSVVTV